MTDAPTPEPSREGSVGPSPATTDSPNVQGPLFLVILGAGLLAIALVVMPWYGETFEYGQPILRTNVRGNAWGGQGAFGGVANVLLALCTAGLLATAVLSWRRSVVATWASILLLVLSILAVVVVIGRLLLPPDSAAALDPPDRIEVIDDLSRESPEFQALGEELDAVFTTSDISLRYGSLVALGASVLTLVGALLLLRLTRPDGVDVPT